MTRLRFSLFALAALSASAVTAVAQNYAQEQPAPIERNGQAYAAPQFSPAKPANQQQPALPTTDSQPAPGVALRTDHPVQTIAADDHRVELRLDHGRANVMIHAPAPDLLVLIDLPGGQVQLLKDGLYTFNADTNTVRVLHGEADAFPGASTNPLKVKEEEQIVLAGNAQPAHFDRYYARQDFLPGNGQQQAINGTEAYDDGDGYAAPPPAYGYAPGYYYGDGYYAGYPYYAYDWGWGWGFPVFGFGWGGWGGYYGGYYGGYRGAYYGRGGYYPGRGGYYPGRPGHPVGGPHPLNGGSFHGTGGSGFHGGNGGGFSHAGGGGGGFHGGGGGHR